MHLDNKCISAVCKNGATFIFLWYRFDRFVIDVLYISTDVSASRSACSCSVNKQGINSEHLPVQY